MDIVSNPCWGRVYGGGDIVVGKYDSCFKLLKAARYSRFLDVDSTF